MTPAWRATKRIIIIAVYLVILASLATAAYFAFRTPPSCNDGTRNQGEEGIDCGGPCEKCEVMPKVENIKIVEKALVSAGQGKYDALIQMKNPNVFFGIANLEYSFDFFDETGNSIFRKEGSSFLLPAETKYIFAFNIEPRTRLSAFEFRVTSFRWQKFTDYEEPNLPVYQKEFNFLNEDAAFAELSAKFQNRSGYDFRKIITKAIVRDSTGKPVAINETNSNDVRVNEEREVIFRWTESFSRNVDGRGVEIHPEANVFDHENFMRKYGSPEQYESYGADNAY